MTRAASDDRVGIDAEGRITLVNAQTEALFGYRRDELPGRPVEVLVPDRLRGAHARHRRGYIATPRTRPMGLDLEQFAYVASHDLREPLRVISGLAEVLQRRLGVEAGEQTSSIIGGIGRGVARMQALIDGLLSCSRAGSTELTRQRIDAQAALERVLDSLPDPLPEGPGPPAARGSGGSGPAPTGRPGSGSPPTPGA